MRPSMFKFIKRWNENRRIRNRLLFWERVKKENYSKAGAEIAKAAECILTYPHSRAKNAHDYYQARRESFETTVQITEQNIKHLNNKLKNL